MTENEPVHKPFFDPTINLGHILSLSGVIITLVAGWYSFDYRLGAAERSLIRLTQVVESTIRQEEQIKALTITVNKLEGIISGLRVKQ